VEKPPQTRRGDIDVYSPEEVWALVRAAASEQDGATFLMAAFTGLRLGELIALHWRDVDFAGSLVRVRASYAGGALTTPKSGKVRSVPLAPEVAKALAKLSQREHFTGDDASATTYASTHTTSTTGYRTPGSDHRGLCRVAERHGQKEFRWKRSTNGRPIV
jgi:integrase